MNISDYETLTGLTVASADEARITASIAKTELLLQSLLGYAFGTPVNEYTELGKTASECPCPLDSFDDLVAADAVVTAYRLYDYNRKDQFIAIDPCTDVHYVKLVNNNVTYKTLEVDEFRMHSDRGLIKFLEQCECFCCCRDACSCVQLAVDADWITAVPDEINYIWADMVTHYGDLRKDIRSETLATHSYTKFSNTEPHLLDQNMKILKRYAGPNGSLFRTITI